MALFKGTQKIAPIINKANTIRNQSKTITSNGTYNADSNYTGLGPVTVNVPKLVEPLTISADHNDIYTATASAVNLNGFSTVEVDVNVPMQSKNYKIVEADLNSNTITIVPDNGQVAMTSVVLDLSEITNLLSRI